MLALEAKQSGGKILPPFGSPGGSVSRGSITQKAKGDDCECGNEPSGSVKCGEFLD